MDLSTLAVTSEGQTLELRHPLNGTLLKTDKGTPISITLVGADSVAFRRAQRAILDKRLNQKSKAKLSAAELEEEAVSTLVGCTVGWSGIVLDGKDLPFNKDNIKALYGRSDLPWIKDQVDEFIADRSNFLIPSVEN